MPALSTMVSSLPSKRLAGGTSIVAGSAEVSRPGGHTLLTADRPEHHRSELPRSAGRSCCSRIATRFLYAVAKKIVLRTANWPIRNRNPCSPSYRSSAHAAPTITRMRRRYTPSKAVASLRVNGRENQQASSAEIALGVKNTVQSGHQTSSHDPTHDWRHSGCTTTSMLMNVIAPTTKT
jgi:hypothetical protein